MNVIRDPVEKFRSFYYFIRNGNLEGDGKDVVMSPAKKARTIDECVAMKVSWKLIFNYSGYNFEIKDLSLLKDCLITRVFLKPLFQVVTLITTKSVKSKKVNQS